MKNVMTPPAEKQPAGTAPPVLATEEEAREVAESAREREWASSFVKELFAGRLLIDLVHPFPEPTAADVVFAANGVDFDALVNQFEHGLLRRALEHSGGNRRIAAELLKIKRTTLIEKLKRLERS